VIACGAQVVQQAVAEQARIARWPGSKWVERVLLEQDELLWGLTLCLLDPMLPRLLEGEGAI